METLLGEFSSGLFFIQTALFVFLLLFLGKFAWKPILNSVNEREENITKALESAEEAKKEMAALQASNEALLKEARNERDQMLKEARDTKNQLISEAKASAKEEADKLMKNAKASIETEKNVALTELKKEVATLSVMVAERILQEQLSDESKQEALINKYVEEINMN